MSGHIAPAPLEGRDGELLADQPQGLSSILHGRSRGVPEQPCRASQGGDSAGCPCPEGCALLPYLTVEEPGLELVASLHGVVERSRAQLFPGNRLSDIRLTYGKGPRRQCGEDIPVPRPSHSWRLKAW